MAQNFNTLTQGLSGHVGNLIFYERNGKPFTRSMPKYGPESMSAASKQSSLEFGKAVKAAKAIRSALNGIWQPAKDETLVYRLNKAVYAALREDTLHERGKRVFSASALHKHLKDFRYNKKAVMAIGGIDTIRQQNGNIMVKLPVRWQHWLKSPKGARFIQLQAVALDMDLEHPSCRGNSSAATCVPLEAKELSLLLPAIPVSSTATIVLLQVRFLHTSTNTPANGTPSSEQAFITAVLEPAGARQNDKPVTPQPTKVSRIIKKERPAIAMLQATSQQHPKTPSTLSAKTPPRHHRQQPSKQYGSPPTLTPLHFQYDHFLI